MGTIEFDFGICVDGGYDEDGHPEIGLDHYGPIGEASGAKGAAIHPFGFEGTPEIADNADATPVGCSALALRNGDHLSMMALEDPRVVAKLPKQRKGGSRQYCADGGYAAFEGRDPDGKVRAGSYIVTTKYEASDGSTKAHVFRMEKRKRGEEQLSLLHGEGHGLLVQGSGKKPVSLKNSKGDGGFTADDDGNTIMGKTKVIGSLMVGPPAAARPLALLEPLIAYLTAFETAAATKGVIVPTPAASLAEVLGTKLLKGL